MVIEFSRTLIASIITGIGTTIIVAGAVLEIHSIAGTKVVIGIVKVVRERRKSSTVIETFKFYSYTTC